MVAPLQLVYDTRVGAPRLIQSSTSAGMKPATAHAESLRREQAARVCAPHGFLVAADVLGDLECCHQSIRQAASCRGVVLSGIVSSRTGSSSAYRFFLIASSESVAPLWAAPMVM